VNREPKKGIYMQDNPDKIKSPTSRDGILSSAPEESARPAPAPHPQRIIAVTSGKGGVGKTNITLNLGITLTRCGHRVMLVDTDLGMANLDLLMGITPKYNLSHVLSGKKQIQDVMINGPSGIKLLPASSGGKRGEKYGLQAKKDLMAAIREQHELADLVFMDTRAGLSDSLIHFLTLADEIILVTTPEPTSIMDSYGIVKILAQERATTKLGLIVNMICDQHDARHVSHTMELVTRQFFNITLEDIGWVPHDPQVSRAVRQQQPFVLQYPGSRAAKAMGQIALKFSDVQVDFLVEHGLRGWWGQLKNLFY
jgi:flagellar biosynthesis protein FlhG